MYFEEKNNDLILKDEYFDLKLTSDRLLYYKIKNRQIFSSVSQNKVPLGYSIEDKKKLLVMLNEKINAEYGNQIDAMVNDNMSNNGKEKVSYVDRYESHDKTTLPDL